MNPPPDYKKMTADEREHLLKRARQSVRNCDHLLRMAVSDVQHAADSGKPAHVVRDKLADALKSAEHAHHAELALEKMVEDMGS